jgi:DegV family protein with EDD domain
MSIKIVTDSTCDLPDALVAEHGITVVPAYINIAGRGYLDGVELSRADFYTQLPGYNPPPTTAAPSPEQFHAAYQQLAATGATEIISIHLSGTLSSLIKSAKMAAQEMRAARVTVFDAQQASMGTGFLALAAARLAEAGHTAAEIAARLADLVPRIYLFAALDTLEFLRRSGRLNTVQAGLGALLQIKPILKLHEGVLLSERVRTRAQSVQRLIELLREIAPLEQLAVLHTQAVERAEGIREQIKALWPLGQPPLILTATPAIGSHVGPGAVGFVAVAAKK